VRKRHRASIDELSVLSLTSLLVLPPLMRGGMRTRCGKAGCALLDAQCVKCHGPLKSEKRVGTRYRRAGAEKGKKRGG